MPKGIPYIVTNEAAERFSFYGMKGILVIFMTKYMMDAAGSPDLMGDVEARQWYHSFTSAVYFFPILGALLADTFFGQLAQGPFQVFGAHRVFGADPAQQFRRKARDPGEMQNLPFGQRIADAQIAVIGQTENVARPGFFGPLPVPGQKQHRVMHVQRFAGAHMV
jgi:hypothetical protein